jgi:hypothetical protein
MFPLVNLLHRAWDGYVRSFIGDYTLVLVMARLGSGRTPSAADMPSKTVTFPSPTKWKARALMNEPVRRWRYDWWRHRKNSRSQS